MLVKLPRTAAKIRPHIRPQEPITRGTPSPYYPSCSGLTGALRCALKRVCHNHRPGVAKDMVLGRLTTTFGDSR